MTGRSSLFFSDTLIGEERWLVLEPLFQSDISSCRRAQDQLTPLRTSALAGLTPAAQHSRAAAHSFPIRRDSVQFCR